MREVISINVHKFKFPCPDAINVESLQSISEVVARYFVLILKLIKTSGNTYRATGVLGTWGTQNTQNTVPVTTKFRIELCNPNHMLQVLKAI